MPSTLCQCTAACGDDPAVIAGRVLGCADYRAARNPALLLQRVQALRASLQAMVDLLDRMEPEVEEPHRATDEEWLATKAQAKRTLDATA